MQACVANIADSEGWPNLTVNGCIINGACTPPTPQRPQQEPGRAMQCLSPRGTRRRLLTKPCGRSWRCYRRGSNEILHDEYIFKQRIKAPGKAGAHLSVPPTVLLQFHTECASDCSETVKRAGVFPVGFTVFPRSSSCVGGFPASTQASPAWRSPETSEGEGTAAAFPWFLRIHPSEIGFLECKMGQKTLPALPTFQGIGDLDMVDVTCFIDCKALVK